MNHSIFDLKSLEKSVRRVPKTERAWMAGLFDGEGCVSHHTRSRTVSLYVRLTVKMTSAPAIDRFSSLVELTGCCLGRYQRDYGPAGKTMYTCVAQNASAIVALILLVRPYATVKAEELDFAFKAMLLKRDGKQAEARELLKGGIGPRKAIGVVA